MSAAAENAGGARRRDGETARAGSRPLLADLNFLSTPTALFFNASCRSIQTLCLIDQFITGVSDTWASARVDAHITMRCTWRGLADSSARAPRWTRC